MILTKYFHALKKRWHIEGGYRDLLRIAVPLILSTGSWSVQQFVDRMYLTWYSPHAIAAALPAGMVNWALMSVFVGTGAYVNTFVAQYYGARRYDRIGVSVWQGVYFALIAEAVVLCVLPLARSLFQLAGHQQAVMEMEITYFSTLCYGAGPMVVSTTVACFFSGRGNTWVLMWVNAATTVVNIVLDYAFIFGHWGFQEMGIKGAALATVLAGCFSALTYLALFLRGKFRREYKTLAGWKFEGDLFARLCRYGLPNGVHFFLDALAFTLFIMMVGKLGTLELASTNIAFNINTLAFMPLIGFGVAVSTLVGQWLGAEKPDLAARSTWSGFHVALVYTLLFAAAYLFFPQLFLKPFALQAGSAEFAPVRATVIVLLRFVALYAISDALNMVFASAIKGAGDTRFVMTVNILLSWFIMLIPSYIGVFVLSGGLYTMWTAVSAYIIILGLIFVWRFLGGKWRSMRVIEEIPRTGITRVPELPMPEAEL